MGDGPDVRGHLLATLVHHALANLPAENVGLKNESLIGPINYLHPEDIKRMKIEVEWLFELTLRPSRALYSPPALLPELKRLKDKVRYGALGAVVLGHCQE